MLKFIILFLCIPLFNEAQINPVRPTPLVQIATQFKKDIPSLAAIFVAGMADGLNQTLEFHYGTFKHVFPKANDEYWNPQISWTNKYKNNNSADGPKYFGSTSFLVWTTDGYHMTRFVEDAGLMSSIVLRINVYEKRKWWYYVIEGAGYWVINRAGFVLVYNGLQIK